MHVFIENGASVGQRKFPAVPFVAAGLGRTEVEEEG